ncbi:MAG: hypothetical protein KC621_19725 [Myxococcales bacterium]|nr:hypothetical protein [Myxococcales bacterium]
MTHAVRLVTTMNALMGATAGVGLLPLTSAWPAFAGSVAERHPPVTVGGTLLDALLCFGPLLVPLVLVASIAAVRATLRREQDAARWNAVAAVGWGLVGAVGVGLVAS